MVDGTNGRPDLSKQEMNMNTAYENETRELTINELDAVTGGENGPLYPVIVGVLREFGVGPAQPAPLPGFKPCLPTGGGAQN
jgi:bacteriocin-like protein